MAKIVIWTPEQAKAELKKRLAYAKEQRQPLEKEWSQNDETIHNTGGEGSKRGRSVAAYTGFDGVVDGMEDNESPDMGVNYSFKNLRFIHAQLCANPPSVVPRPNSPDLSDRRKADAADRLIRHGLRAYKLKEVFDKHWFNALRHGTSFVKTVWDPESGDPLAYDEGTGEITMEGDICIRPVTAKELFLDPDAKLWEDVKWVFHELRMPYEEACYRFPNAKEELQKYRRKQDQGYSDLESQDDFRSPFETTPYDVVCVYEYWEKGLPFNGMVGRHGWCLDDGTPLQAISASPFSFSAPKDKGLSLPEETAAEKREGPLKAYLPFHPLTDIDVADSPYGRSFLAYDSPLQAWYNRLLTVVLDNVQVHGVARLLLPENCEIAEDSLTNTPTDIIKYSGNQPPTYMQPMALPQGVADLLQMARAGIDDLAGVNESMFGQQSREQSGFSMQYATNQGNMIRRRLFDNVVMCVESVYWAYLNLIRKHWKVPRTIAVLGKEKAFEADDIQGADIEGGFDLVVEYGTSLSLDPITRRQELLSLYPIMKEAETSPVARRLLSMVKLNELDGYIDGEQMAADRQREIFEEMIATDAVIPIGEQENDALMVEWADRYRMSAEFKYLTPEHQTLVLAHMKARKERLAQTAQALAPQPAQGAPPTGPTAPAPAPTV